MSVKKRLKLWGISRGFQKNSSMSATVAMADTTVFNMFRENGASAFLMKRLEKKLMEDNYLVNTHSYVVLFCLSWI